MENYPSCSYDSNQEGDSGICSTAYEGDFMDVRSRYWLDYDMVAIAVLMVAVWILELLALGFLSLHVCENFEPVSWSPQGCCIPFSYLTC